MPGRKRHSNRSRKGVSFSDRVDEVADFLYRARLFRDSVLKIRDSIRNFRNPRRRQQTKQGRRPVSDVVLLQEGRLKVYQVPIDLTEADMRYPKRRKKK